MHCGIGTKQEMELMSCDLTSCYLCKSFTDLQSKNQKILKSKNQKIKKSKNQKIKKSKKSKKSKIKKSKNQKNQKFDYLII